MRLVSTVLPALAFAFVLMATGAEAGSAAPARSTTSVEFKLAAGHGFHASVETYRRQVTLLVVRRHRFASYSVGGQISESGAVEARFGQLGQISVAFEPDDPVPDPCAPGDEGVFVGTIRFSGERNYLKLDAERARGIAYIPRDTTGCEAKTPGVVPEVLGGRRLNALRRIDSDAPAGRKAGKADTATLGATARHGGRFFIALGVRGGGSRNATYFAGGLAERRRGMQVVRGASTPARAGTFVFDPSLTSATVRPPGPFRGKATYRRKPGGPTSWTGSLIVPILGGDIIRLAGPGMTAKMVHRTPSD